MAPNSPFAWYYIDKHNCWYLDFDREDIYQKAALVGCIPTPLFLGENKMRFIILTVFKSALFPDGHKQNIKTRKVRINVDTIATIQETEQIQFDHRQRQFKSNGEPVFGDGNPAAIQNMLPVTLVGLTTISSGDSETYWVTETAAEIFHAIATAEVF